MHSGLPALAGRIAQRGGHRDLPGTDRGAAPATLHRPGAQPQDDGTDSVLSAGRGEFGRIGAGIGTRAAAGGAAQKILNESAGFVEGETGQGEALSGQSRELGTPEKQAAQIPPNPPRPSRELLATRTMPNTIG